jgi:hypothetical protein
MRALILLLAVTAACVPATAAADGLPVLGIDVGSSGVSVPASPDRYVTIDEGGRTLVERIARNSGRVVRYASMPGTFTIPAVAYDGSASGLSADGRTLVLIEPRQSFPRRVTRFALLDAGGLDLFRTITLDGDFSFDAISPHGRTMYLVNYTHAGDPTRYAVRAYDLSAGRLLPKPIVDPLEHSDKMRGSPITRLTSPDGRWAYTLYDGAGTTPFVHALDTSAGTAHCIDLDMLTGRSDLWALRLQGERGHVRIVAAHEPVAVVDTATFSASLPSGPSGRDLRPWLAAAVAGLGIALALLAKRRGLRGRPAPA